MPTLEFKGKQIIYAHHLTVPVRALDAHPAKSFPPQKSPPELDGNLIIHGDNLHALKALLPRYAGRVHCIYIDPPYNTGNEKWIYNDNVNSPQMRDWLKGKNPVDGEDLERHDKWLCMMWPRLHLLRELLAEDGVIFVSIDDNELRRLHMVMDEVFEERNFIANLVWQNKEGGGKSDSKFFRIKHEYILCYAKNAPDAAIASVGIKDADRYTRSDEYEKERGKHQLIKLDSASIQYSKSLDYPIKSPDGTNIFPAKRKGKNACWRWSRDKLQWGIRNGFVVIRKNKKGEWSVYTKQYLNCDSDGNLKPRRLQPLGVIDEFSTTQSSRAIEELFGKAVFKYSKPSELVAYFLERHPNKDAIILDSFAGSGTTAHAALALNKSDGGNRKFILVECEDYADKVTAERVRLAIKTGLGGRFTYCTLGKEIDAEKMLTGENLPDYETLARHLVWLNTGDSPKTITQRKDGFFYETNSRLYHLIYEPNLEFLRSADSALDGDRADRIAKKVAEKGKPAVVFAAAKYVGQKELTKMNITFAALPFAVEGVV
ncbi:MAG: site-specific DNA-methyltransferase [Gammaproteobacteria bacterium]|nr:site-specific DNA-methyltransferase [Gammaproteobacteria bacterium]